MSDNVAQCDYITLTFPETIRNQAYWPSLLAMVHDGVRMFIRGYIGNQYERMFCGSNGERTMVSATGNAAAKLLRSFDFSRIEELSVARFDVQVTIPCADPDNVIYYTKPSTKYKATLIRNLNEEGMTLYIGSAKSRARMRIYNKTAESGMTTDNGMKLLRVELQTRDENADAAMTYYKLGQLDKYFLVYVKRMTDAYVSDMVDRHLQEPGQLCPVEDEDVSDWLSRRIGWLEGTVKPSIMKLAVEDPELAIGFIRSLWYDITGEELK